MELQGGLVVWGHKADVKMKRICEVNCANVCAHLVSQRECAEKVPRTAEDWKPRRKSKVVDIEKSLRTG